MGTSFTSQNNFLFFFLFHGEEMRGLSQKSRFSYGTCCTEREEESGSDAER